MTIYVNQNNPASKQPTNERTAYFDYLRVFATFAVIVLHVSAQNWYSTDVNGQQWQIFNFFDSIVRWSVPVFVMISGALFLGKEISIRRIYKKYVPRMIISYFVWATVYYAINENRDSIDCISVILQGNYHMWFIPMMTGLYMSIPFFKTITLNKSATKYFITLAFLFTFLFGTIVSLTSDFCSHKLIQRISEIYSFLSRISINTVLGYSAYFVLGYYLNSVTIKKKTFQILVLLGVLGFISTILLNSIIAIRTQEPCGNYYSDFCVNVFFESVLVFLVFKHHGFKTSKFMKNMSQYCFGIYLVHALVIDQIDKLFALNTLSFHPVLSVPLISVVVFIVSFIISALINHIPFVKRYMV